MPSIDREKSAARIARDVETLTGSAYTQVSNAIQRYAYTDVYTRTLAYFQEQLEALDFTVGFDPVGTLVARNRPPGRRP